MRLGRGLSFSPSRFLGIAQLKSRIARTVQVPTTRGGRQRKWGRMGGMK